MILIVEDNKHIITMIKHHLTHLGYESQAVDNGEAALSIVQEQDFCLVFMDCHLPGINGFDTAHSIRNLGKEMPIIALSADNIDRHRDRYERAKMNDYLGKPYTIKQLASMLDKWVPNRDLSCGRQ